MPNPTTLPLWKKIEKHYRTVKDRQIIELFDINPQRFTGMNRTLPGLLMDFSKTNIDADGLKLLINLARTQNVDGWRDRMFAGAAINTTENRPALHTALRRPKNDLVTLSGRSIMPDIHAVLNQMRVFSDQIRSGAWTGHKGQAITDIVNIGIGGQDLGVHLATASLSAFHHPTIRAHFISNIDGQALFPLLKILDPARTLFLISSKTFTTEETLANAARAKSWLTDSGIRLENLHQHMVVISANPKAADILGLPTANLFPFWDYIGGRFSVWGAGGLACALMIGFDRFRDFLNGANAMDRHFATAPLEQNIPVLLALCGIWHINFCDSRALAILPYDERLTHLPAYIQQIDMESNGKGVDRDGEPIDFATAPAVFGSTGTSAQHSFFQCLHQGPNPIPTEFIAVRTHDHPWADHHRQLCANAVAQAQALMIGEETDDPATTCPGNRPSIFIAIDKLDPYHLGMLMTLYEHKIFVQGTIWNLNSFDQPGVFLGKKLAKDLIQTRGKGADSSTATLWRVFEG